MKKVFLFLTATVFGVAAMAGEWASTTTVEGAQTVTIPYNKYGDGDNGSGEIAYSWQKGNQKIVEVAVEEALGEDFDGWLLAKGQQFSFQIKGTCNATGTLKTGLVDEQKEAAYWYQNSAFASPEIPVTKDEVFEASFVYTINALATDVTEGFVVEGETLHPTKNVTGLVLGFAFADYATASAFNGQAMSEDPDGAKKVEFNFTEFKFEYMGDLSVYTKPYALTYQKPADIVADGFQYQYSADLDHKTAVTTSDFFNFKIKGVATQDISSLMIALWDGTAGAQPKPWATSLCEEGGDGMATIKTDIKKGETFSVQGTLPIMVPSNTTEQRFQVVFMAQSQYEGTQVILDLKDADEFTIGESKNYGNPRVAVEEIAAEDAIVNGVIYSEGAIVIYNQAGQKVAAASQEFAIASFGAGIYFAQTAEGSFSFVVK
ncbi:MAG: hypothetical protein J6X43_10795 [Bacteroidales bacterium]|nr:hypothetical protein [Bacteroidales bacterium]